MLKKRYNLILIGICTVLLLLTSIIMGINYNNNRKHDLTRELYKTSVSVVLNNNTIDAEISSVKWKSHKGDYLDYFNVDSFSEEVEEKDSEGNYLKPEEVALKFRFDINEEMNGTFTLERVTVLAKDLTKSSSFKNKGKIEKIDSLVKESEVKYTYNDTKQNIEEEYYQMYFLHFDPEDDSIIENYWCFGVHFNAED